jgi:hypothetical protein
VELKGWVPGSHLGTIEQCNSRVIGPTITCPLIMGPRTQLEYEVVLNRLNGHDPIEIYNGSAVTSEV